VPCSVVATGICVGMMAVIRKRVCI
jgi:hypothetical protein